jgi:hypothetical protein
MYLDIEQFFSLPTVAMVKTLWNRGEKYSGDMVAIAHSEAIWRGRSSIDEVTMIAAF